MPNETYEALKQQKPEGQRTGESSPEDRKLRKTVLAKAVAAASFKDEELSQAEDLATLPEFEGMKRNGIGDFLGKGGIDLDRKRKGKDWLIPPGPWQAFKAWDWLKDHAPEELEAVAEAAGFDSVEAAEAHLLEMLEKKGGES